MQVVGRGVNGGADLTLAAQPSVLIPVFALNDNPGFNQSGAFAPLLPRPIVGDRRAAVSGKQGRGGKVGKFS